MALLLALVRERSGVVTFVPGLLLMGLGVGTMLTSSVNVVQSAFPDSDQGDISGLSRSVSNLGSSLGTALAGPSWSRRRFRAVVLMRYRCLSCW
jgi:predicted MFS family arabinose efflux permease